MKPYCQRMDPSPAEDHESIMLELSGAWELVDSLKVWRFSPSTRSCSGVFSQNMTG